jgi:hypothetical protein
MLSPGFTPRERSGPTTLEGVAEGKVSWVAYWYWGINDRY